MSACGSETASPEFDAVPFLLHGPELGEFAWKPDENLVSRSPGVRLENKTLSDWDAGETVTYEVDFGSGYRFLFLEAAFPLPNRRFAVYRGTTRPNNLRAAVRIDEPSTTAGFAFEDRTVYRIALSDSGTGEGQLSIAADVGSAIGTVFEFMLSNREDRVFASAFDGQQPFEQGDGQDSLVRMEAESFHVRVANEVHSWVLDETSGASGGAAMRGDPELGQGYSAEFAADSPRLDYRIDFKRSGPHYVWIRGWGPDNGSDTCNAGLNGAVSIEAMKVLTGTDWTWQGDMFGDRGRAMVDVPSVGEHTFSIWMREDGARIDAIILTPDAGFTP